MCQSAPVRMGRRVGRRVGERLVVMFFFGNLYKTISSFPLSYTGGDQTASTTTGRHTLERSGICACDRVFLLWADMNCSFYSSIILITDPSGAIDNNHVAFHMSMWFNCISCLFQGRVRKMVRGCKAVHCGLMKRKVIELEVQCGCSESVEQLSFDRPFDQSEALIWGGGVG